jgi:hypothetical protein
MDNSSQRETLLVDGQQVPVDRADYQHLIERTAVHSNCTTEEAWDHVKEHLVATLTVQNRGKGRSPASTPSQRFAETPVADPTREISKAALVARAGSLPQIVSNAGGRYLLRLNGAPINALHTVDIPPSLARSRLSVLEMISQGMLDLEGEHEDAALLRAAAPSGLFDTGAIMDPTRLAAVEAVNQRQFQYPLQKQTVRILPSDFSKTSLFHVASNNTPRRFYEDEMLGKVGDTTRIVYRGQELRHDDELVFMQLLHVARGKRPYEWLSFNVSKFFRGSRGTRRSLSVKDTRSVSESLLRLRQGMLIVTNTTTKKFITVNLIKDLQGDPANQRALIDPVVVLLCSSFAAINTDHLFQLSGVSRQILKYLSTIPNRIERLHPINITSLFELCYGTIESLQNHYREENPDKPEAKVRIAISKKVSDFRRVALPAAMNTLKAAGILDFAIDGVSDKITITRDPAASTASVEGALPDENESADSASADEQT